MTVKGILLSITILISMFFVDIEQIQYITIMTVSAFIFFYIKLPPTFVLLFAALSWSILYKNTVLAEANTIFYDTTAQYKQAPIKVAQDNIITAEVITLVNRKNILSFDVKVIEINNTPLSFIQPKITLQWPSAEYHYSGDIGIGQVWRFKIWLTNPSIDSGNYLIPSFKSSLLSRHIQYMGIIDKGEIVNPKLSLRGKLYHAFKVLLPSDANPMLYALTFGDRSYITPALWELFKLLGIAHLVAISGLHIGLIFGFSAMCSRYVLQLCGCQYYLALSLSVGLVAALFYAWIAGFSLPALRAIILLCIHSLYRLQYYKVTLLQLFTTMLLVTLILDPLTAFSISFWLSFSAIGSVFILIWIIRPETRYIVENSSIKNRLGMLYQKSARLCHSQILLTLFILPLQVMVFAGFSLLSVIINLIFIPIFSVCILPVLLIAMMLFPVIPIMSGILINIVNMLLNRIQTIWKMVTTYDVIWLDVGNTLTTAVYNLVLLISILLLAGFILKPLRVVFYSLSLLLLPLVYYTY